MYDIRDVIDIYVESSFYARQKQEISISNYTLTRLTERSMDIQIDFTDPTKLSLSSLEPDELIVKFKNPSMFMDKEDATQLDEDLTVDSPLQP